MKNLRGYKKRYFKLSTITIYSASLRLGNIETNFLYHKIAFDYKPLNRDPPLDLEI